MSSIFNDYLLLRLSAALLLRDMHVKNSYTFSTCEAEVWPTPETVPPENCMT
jgi:hypothetical protein